MTTIAFVFFDKQGHQVHKKSIACISKIDNDERGLKKYHVSFKDVINKQASTSPQATSLRMLNSKFLFTFLQVSYPLWCFNDHSKVNVLSIGCSFKEEG